MQLPRHFRAVVTRYDKRDDNFLASIQFASIRIRLPHSESVTGRNRTLPLALKRRATLARRAANHGPK